MIDPTCTASGYDEYVCTVCGYEYHDHFTAPLGQDVYKRQAYTHTAFGNVSAAGQAYQSDNELVGLLTLEETEYQIPSSSEVTSIWLDIS